MADPKQTTGLAALRSAILRAGRSHYVTERPGSEPQATAGCERRDQEPMTSQSQTTARMLPRRPGAKTVVVQQRIEDVLTGPQKMSTPETTDDAAARILAAWLGYAWDGLPDRDISDAYPDWCHSTIGGRHLQGGKPALRRITAQMMEAANGKA